MIIFILLMLARLELPNKDNLVIMGILAKEYSVMFRLMLSLGLLLFIVIIKMILMIISILVMLTKLELLMLKERLEITVINMKVF